MTDATPATMQALHLQSYGAPLDVLNLESVPVPEPAEDQILVKVHACALNPMDWVICQGFFPGTLPRGVGLDVSGTVHAIGAVVTNVAIGDLVFGVPDYMACPTAGAADYAIMSACFPVPPGLDLDEAAALPMSVETAVRALDLLGVAKGQTLLVNGGGTMVGFAAVQIARMRGVDVITTAGDTFADRLKELGAKVTPYGDGMVERVREIAGGPVDLVLHAAQVQGALPDLIKIAGHLPERVMSLTDFDEGGLGVRRTGNEPDLVPRYDALEPFARLAAEGRFTIPIAQKLPLSDWREAVQLSLSGKAHGKVLLQIEATEA